MSTSELRKKLIDKIGKTENKDLLEEAYRLLANGSEEIEPYTLTDEQLNVVREAQQQIKNGDSLTNDQADKETDEWLSK